MAWAKRAAATYRSQVDVPIQERSAEQVDAAHRRLWSSRSPVGCGSAKVYLRKRRGVLRERQGPGCAAALDAERFLDSSA